MQKVKYELINESRLIYRLETGELYTMFYNRHFTGSAIAAGINVYCTTKIESEGYFELIEKLFPFDDYLTQAILHYYFLPLWCRNINLNGVNSYLQQIIETKLKPTMQNLNFEIIDRSGNYTSATLIMLLSYLNQNESIRKAWLNELILESL